MANEQNLIPNSKRTPSELRELTSKGGKASGKARRKKADLKKAFNTLLNLDVQDKKIKKQLEDLGMDGDNQALLAFSVFQQAVKGNQKAVENLIKLTNTKDDLDIKEQKERIKSIKLDNEKKSKDEEINKESKLDDYFSKLEEVLKDGN